MISNTITQKPDYKLYKITGIAIATLFGSVLAGGILMAKNYQSLGKTQEAKNAIIYSAIALIAILIISISIPDNWHIPNLVFTIPQFIVIRMLATQHQAVDIKNHEDAGGELTSNWKAFGISLLVVLSILAALFILAFSFISIKEMII